MTWQIGLCPVYRPLCAIAINKQKHSPHHVTKAVPHSTVLEYAEHGNNEHGINFTNFG